jgi:hypothetical protein
LFLSALPGCSSPESVGVTPVDDTDFAREAIRSVASASEAGRAASGAVETGDDWPARRGGATYRVGLRVGTCAER